MNLLAIETSCDETALAIFNFDKKQKKMPRNFVFSDFFCFFAL
jgi:tRNA A37 threonylcarbamoyltransferase TsaD